LGDVVAVAAGERPSERQPAAVYEEMLLAAAPAVVGRYVRQRLIRDVWSRGIVHIKLIGDLPVGSGALEEARRAAVYLAKYVSKNIGDERVPRLHR
jgi:hypothetical protein